MRMSAVSDSEPAGESRLEAAIERLIFVRADEYTVARLVSEEQGEFTAAGAALAGVQPGSVVLLEGRWTQHARFGAQLSVRTCECVLPSHIRGIRMYLGSGLIRGIGPNLAAAIVERFGEDTLKVIDSDPERLTEVNGIGAVRKDRIVSSWIGQKVIRDLMVVLQGFGISPLMAAKIYAEFGADSLAVVRKDPYLLIEKVRGIGFAIADKIALASGVAEQDPKRLRAALADRLDAARRDGHCYVNHTRLLVDAARLVGQDRELVRIELDELAALRAVIVEPDPNSDLNLDLSPDTDPTDADPPATVVFAKVLHNTERALAAAITKLLHADSDVPAAARRRAETLDVDHPDLHDGQRAAVRMALTHTVSVLTGGPGCGKSHTVKTIAQIMKAGGGRVTLAAPTGKAAKRLSDLVGMPAMTVHRLVADLPDADPDALFDDSPLMADLIVVDEASMLDVFLGLKLARQVPSGTHLLLVGDVDQLPSIGPGSVLKDLLRVPEIARTELTHVFRQGEGSSITANAHLIRAGRMPNPRTSEFWFDEVEDPGQVAERILEIATVRIPATHGVPPSDVQVLAPTRRGSTGTVELGRRLQERLNPADPDKAEHWAGTSVFRIGDKVMPIRNDPNKGSSGIFNGTTAIVSGLDPQSRTLQLRTDDGDFAVYDFDELDDLLHAYAISVHRSQGSEYPYVVAPLTTETGPLMLYRNLLYTLVTRARKLVVLVGQRRALEIAVHSASRDRNTALARRLEAELDRARVVARGA
jgi:exodeoxyribonuclease V alpha subunit